MKLYSSSESSSAVHFNQIHESCGSRLKQQMICAKENVPVKKTEIVKGYEFAKDQYVLFTVEELKALEEKATHTIDIAEFVQAEQVDRIYLEKVYYLGPDKGGARAYHLLSKALSKTKRAALGQYSARGKEYLVLVRPLQNGLAMEQLRYRNEIRPFSEVPLDDSTEVKQAELDLAVQLVEQQMTDKFRPEKFKDQVHERTLELIQKKIEGEDITVAGSSEPEHKIIDLMEALKASIAKETAEPAPKRKPARRAAAPRKPARKKSTG